MLLRNLLTTVIAGSMILSSVAHAASNRSGNGNVNVDLPQTDLKGTDAEALHPVTPSWIEFGLSSWEPSNFTLPANFGSTIAFSVASVPSFFLNYVRMLGPSFNLIVGLNFLAMDRTTPVNFTGGPGSDTQTVDLLSVRAGVEFSPAAFSDWAVRPFMTGALLPTFGLTSQSPFASNGNVYFGVPLEFSLGGRMGLNKIGLPWDGIALEASASATVGRVDYQSFQGFGFGGGIRVSL